MAAAAVVGWWIFLRPHVITVCAYADPAFQTRDHWKETLETRFREVSRIYSRQTGVAWKVVEVPAKDPERNVGGLDQRRRELLLETGCKADVLVEIATSYVANNVANDEGARPAGVNAFSHAAVITDRPGDTEQKNTLRLAHELAHIFGASHDDAGAATIMAANPASRDIFSADGEADPETAGLPVCDGRSRAERRVGWPRGRRTGGIDERRAKTCRAGTPDAGRGAR